MTYRTYVHMLRTIISAVRMSGFRWEGVGIYSFVSNIESFIQIHSIGTLTSDSI